MSDRFGEDRRRGDRRAYNDPNYAGPNRRVGPRRAPDNEPRSKIGLIVAVIAVFIIADAALWDGKYRHAAMSSFYTETDSVREWSAHIWDMS